MRIDYKERSMANISMDFFVKKKDSPCCEKNVFFDKLLSV